jgi:hypothetical protein
MLLFHPDQPPQRRRRAPQRGRNRQRQGRRTGLDDLGRRTLRLDAASKFGALDHGFASRRIGSVSAALPGQVDARLHVDRLELRGWTRYQSIRFTDRTLTAVVQSACNKPVSTLITHDHVRSAHGAWMAGPCRIPKLTVRVRFPSPAHQVKSLAAQANSTISVTPVNAHSRSKRHPCDPRPALRPDLPPSPSPPRTLSDQFATQVIDAVIAAISCGGLATAKPSTSMTATKRKAPRGSAATGQ